MAEKKKPKYDSKRAWAEARALIWVHRRSVSIGLALMLVSRAAGFVLPASTKWLIDDVVGKHRMELLTPLALAAGAAVLINAITAFALSQVVSVAAQRAISTLREDVQAHLVRLPVRFFDSTKSGMLVSRVMNDPEGIRNLVSRPVTSAVMTLRSRNSGRSLPNAMAMPPPKTARNTTVAEVSCQLSQKSTPSATIAVKSPPTS